MHFTLLVTAGIIGTRLHPWKAIQCENEKPPEGLACQKFKQGYPEEWFFCFSCAGPQRLLQPRPERHVYISRWRQDLAPFMLVLQKSRTQGSWGSEMLVHWFQKKPVRAVCNTVVRFLEERI